jgi:hypothetical protein
MATLPADGQAVPGERTPVPEADNTQARPSSQSSGWKAVGYAFGSRSRGRTPVSEGAPAKVGTSSARDTRPSTPSAPPPAAVVTVEQLESALAMSACAIRCVSWPARETCNSLLALVQLLLKPSASRLLFYHCSAGQNAAQAQEERNTVLELRLHEVTSELAVARRALAARDDHDAQMAAELRAAKVSSKSNTVATHDCNLCSWTETASNAFCYRDRLKQRACAASSLWCRMRQPSCVSD